MTNIITLKMDTPSIQHLCKCCNHLEQIINTIGSLTYTRHEANPYAHLVYNIIGQMLSNNVADIMTERMLKLCNGKITPESVSLLADERIKKTGISNAKVRCIRDVTNRALSGELDFRRFPEMSDQEIIKELTSIKGIGNWTAKMYLIFVLDRQDILPFEDGAFLKAYRWIYKSNDISPTAIQQKCAMWKPYSSIAARYLYRALDSGMTKKSFILENRRATNGYKR